jgi:DNA-binding MarR family transcriptional regulator
MTADGNVTADPDVHDIAAALRVSIGLLVRQLRQAQPDGDITLPETSALARLDRGGPATPSELARLERISPQSVGATIAALDARGLVERRPDPGDRRRAVISLTEAGSQMLRHRRNVRTERLATALSAGFSRSELNQLMAAAPLIERLAQSF